MVLFQKVVQYDAVTGDPLPAGSAALTSVDATIANGTSLSGAVDLGAGMTLVGIITPSGWTTAVVTFQSALALAGTLYDLYTLGGVEVASPAPLVAQRWHPIDPADFIGVRYLIVRSGTGAVPVNQSSGDVLKLIVRAL